ncbi:MAG: hypothetical protein ACE361_12600 [Aureliella sp.]
MTDLWKPVIAFAAVAGLSQSLPAQDWQPTRIPSGNVAHISTAATSRGQSANEWTPNRPAQSNSPRTTSRSSIEQRSRVTTNEQSTTALRWKKPEQFSSATSIQDNATATADNATATADNATATADNATATADNTAASAGWAPQRHLESQAQSASRSTAPQAPLNGVRFASQVETAAAQSVLQPSHETARRRFTAQDAFGGNPLRGAQPSHHELQGASNARTNADSQVRLANYQQAGDVFGDNFGTAPVAPNLNGGLPQTPNTAPLQFTQPQGGDSTMPALPQAGGAFSDNPANALEILPQQGDPLSSSEPPPAPGAGSNSAPAIPSETQNARPNERPNPFDDSNQSMGESSRFGEAEVVPSPDPDEDEQEDFLKRDDASSINCNEARNRIRPRPLRELSLDVSPAFGEGLRAVRGNTDDQRLEFAANARVRDWYDYRNNFLTTGRLVDLRDDRIVLEANGVERKIRLQNLSDVDLAYVGEAWNIPLNCGSGNDTFEGRNFVASTVQWKAPGHCHKPLYFEQTQLERYGHEAGPIVQPLISTAHFFANIAVLPYKMGIHPPNECQYSLGYYRPGNCAPYMVQPLPLSLRGAAAQAGFVTGAAALIP